MEYRDHLLREIACYQKLDATAHPYVLSSLGNNGDLEAPALYLPYMENGDLMTYLELHGTKTTPAQRMKWAFQLTLAILYLHEQRIFHTDLRPPNILIDAELNLKVADFEGASFDGHGGTACVTPQYSTKQYGFYASLTDDKLREVDIFCLAGLLYVIQTGMEPFEAFEEDAQFLEAYGQQNFPDMSGVALGDLIEDIWRGDITNAKDILVRIVNDNNFLDLLC
ncbi:kinase-like protein [Calocera viscosa TUFC12733]|uniref:Kinase-like protein n=1 Tax=Calocera viscosa (strain TUFC12733) TaxID=1330018 RepID=A0A167H7J5_CALVF|nr:kinase-like protein [Calocera viscosa TUFC12733]